MKTYIVKIEELNIYEIEVEADNKTEAREIARDLMGTSEEPEDSEILSLEVSNPQ